MMHVLLLSSLFTLGLLLWIAAMRPARRHPASALRAEMRRAALHQLGLNEAADARAIRAAHKRLMARYHPDHGGSHNVAAALNRARDVLLGH